MDKKIVQPRPLLTGLCLLLTAVSSQAADFRHSLEAAWQQLPEQQYLATEQDINNRHLPSWLAAVPSIALDYQQGDSASDSAEEWQTRLELPLAKPGLRQSRRDYQQSASNETLAYQQVLRWQLAAKLQTWWWDWQTLSLSQQRTQDRLAAMEQQQQWLDLLIRQGERPAADRLTLQEQYQQLKNQQLQDQRQQQMLHQQWQQWTALNELPTDWTFMAVPEQPLDNHPLLQWLQIQTQLSDAQLRGQQNNSLNPRLSLGVKHQQAVNAQPASDVLQVGISVDFGSANYSERRDAVRQLGSRHAEWLRNRQQLQAERQAIGNSLPVLQQRMHELNAMSEQASAQYQSQYQAYQRGNLSGFQWLQIQASIWRLQQQADEARIEYLRTISQWNQLQGSPL